MSETTKILTEVGDWAAALRATPEGTMVSSQAIGRDLATHVARLRAARVAEYDMRVELVPPPTPGCVCEAMDYETDGPCRVPGHDSRVPAACALEACRAGAIRAGEDPDTVSCYLCRDDADTCDECGHEKSKHRDDGCYFSGSKASCRCTFGGGR